jgi:aminopeptidase N
MWIHEGFCTYTESIYVEELYGHDTAMLYLNAKKKHLGNKEPIAGPYGVNEEGSGDMYSKGALFLNTLRTITNSDEKWWSYLKGLCDTTFKIKNISFENVAKYFSIRMGDDLIPVFQQYVRHAQIPVFEYKLKKQKKGEFGLSYRWVTDVKNFKMPVIISTSGSPKQLLKTTNDFQNVTIKLKKETDFKVNQDLEYIEVKKLL